MESNNEIRIGEKVKIVNHPTFSSLNGQLGVVVDAIDSENIYLVKIEDFDDEKPVVKDNILRLKKINNC